MLTRTHSIVAPGIVRGLSIEAYHDDSDSISSTGLLDLARSPLHYHALHVNDKRPPRATKPGQLEGTLAHVATLEPHALGERYAIGPTCNRNTKRWHEFADDEAAGKARICIQQEQLDVARAQAFSLHAVPELGPLLMRGDAEVSAYWIDAATGVRCRCRPDFTHRVRKQGVILIDVKTCGDASGGEFSRQVARKCYDVQAAFYSDGYEAATDVPVIGFVFAAVEDQWPYAANAVMLDDESLDVGRREVRRLLDLYARCRERNEWPGYADRIELIALPAWRMKS